MTPRELLDRLARLIPQPRRHRHRYHGVFAPNAPLRAQVTALLDDSPADAPPTTDAPDPTEPPTRPPHAYLWAILIARISATAPASLRAPTLGALAPASMQSCIPAVVRDLPTRLPRLWGDDAHHRL